MLSLNGNEKVISENCGTQTTKLNLARHKKISSAGTLQCTQCPNFSTKSRIDLKYHLVMKHSPTKADNTFKCKICYREFPGFYALRQHKNIQLGFPIKKTNVGPDDMDNKADDGNLIKELLSCQIFLVCSELERTRQKVFKYAIDNLNATIVDRKPEQFFNKPKCSPKENLALQFVVLIVTLLSKEHKNIHLGATFDYMHWTSENVYPRNVYKNPEYLFDKLDSFGIKYPSEQKLYKSVAL